MKRILSACCMSLLASCSSIDVNTILEGSSHACGAIHLEGYFTDSQGQVTIVKAPADWTPEQVLEFCAQGS